MIHGMYCAFNNAATASLEAPDGTWDGEAAPGQKVGGQKPTVQMLKGPPLGKWQAEDLIEAPGVIGSSAQDKFLAGYGWTAEQLGGGA